MTDGFESNYRKLLVWQQAVELSMAIYQATASFPLTEQFGLTSQLRRASVSIAANIAEGSGRSSKKEFAQFVSIAIGSLREVETFIEIATKLGYLSRTQGLEDQCLSVARLLTRLRQSLALS